MRDRRRGEALRRTVELVVPRRLREGEGGAILELPGRRRLPAELQLAEGAAERAREGVRILLAGLHPGWALRAVAMTWPDVSARERFLAGLPEGQGAWRDLREALALFLRAAPPPLVRRVLVELDVPAGQEGEGESWLAGMAAALAPYGLRLRRLSAAEAEEWLRAFHQLSLSRWARFAMEESHDGGDPFG
jgi:hypothetical protein